METFYKWLIAQEYRNDAIGDLAQNIKRDSYLPNKKTKLSLLNHLHKNASDEDVVETLNEAWIEYKRFRRIINR